MKFALVYDFKVLPKEVAYDAVSPLIVLRHPIFVEVSGLFENVVVTHSDSGSIINEEQTEKNLRKALKSGKIDFVDVMNVELYSSFERNLVAIVTNHASVDDLSKNIPFYKALAKFLYEGGLKNYPEYDFAILNGLEIRDVAHDFQLETFQPERNFFLVILKDEDTGYLYDDIIIRENENMAQVMTADTIARYLDDYKAGKLQVYLRSETRDPTLTYKEGIL